MRVVLRYLDTPGTSGIKRYSLALWRALEAQGVEVRANRVLSREFKVAGRRVGGHLTKGVWERLPVPSGDLVHAATFHVNPPRRPADVVTVHDIIPVRHPELYGLDEGDVRVTEAAVRRTFGGWVVADTQHTKDEILRHFPDADAGRIVPVHLGIDLERFRPDERPPQAWGGTVLDALRPGMLNVAVVMNVEMRKRLDLLLEAAADLPFVRVVHVGHATAGPRHKGMVDRLARLVPPLRGRGQYVQLGHVDDADVRLLLSNAGVVMHPSMDEGFSLPPLEALACGARVLASDIPPHAEVLGAAARRFPLTAAGIARALEAAWDGEAVRESAFPARASRVAHARAFTWDRTAAQTAAVYAQALEAGTVARAR